MLRGLLRKKQMPRSKFKEKPEDYVPSYKEAKDGGIAELISQELPTRHFSPDSKSEAFAMYLYGHPLEEISVHFGVDEKGRRNLSKTQLRAWIKEYQWEKRRAEVFAESYEKMIQPFANAGVYAYQTGLAILSEQLRKKMVKGGELEWDEMKKLSDIISSIQKVARLDEGKATDITEHKTLREQRQEIRLILKSDPFQEFADAIDITPELEKVAYEPDTSDGASDSDSGAE